MDATTQAAFAMTESQYVVAEEKQAHFGVSTEYTWQKVIIHHSWHKP